MQIQSHVRREIKTKRRKKNHTKQCHHKYEICLMEMIKKEFVSNFTYPKCMITCSMKKKRRGKENEKRKKRFHFFDRQVRTGRGF